MSDIKTDCSDDDLSAAVAEAFHIDPSEQWEAPDGELLGGHIPDLATSADAVLPLLEKWGRETPGYLHTANLIDGWIVWIEKDPFTRYESRQLTFARAACFALLKAKGWTVEDEP